MGGGGGTLQEFSGWRGDSTGSSVDGGGGGNSTGSSVDGGGGDIQGVQWMEKGALTLTFQVSMRSWWAKMIFPSSPLGKQTSPSCTPPHSSDKTRLVAVLKLSLTSNVELGLT